MLIIAILETRLSTREVPCTDLIFTCSRVILVSYTIIFPLQIRQKYVNFRPRNSGSFPDRASVFLFSKATTSALETTQDGEGLFSNIMWPMCINDHSVLFTAHVPYGVVLN